MRLYDTRGRPDDARRNYERAIEDGAQLIIGLVTSAEVMAIPRDAVRVPTFHLASVDPQVFGAEMVLASFHRCNRR